MRPVTVARAAVLLLRGWRHTLLMAPATRVSQRLLLGGMCEGESVRHGGDEKSVEKPDCPVRAQHATLSRDAVLVDLAGQRPAA